MTSFCSTTDTLVWLCDTAIDWDATGSMLSGWGTLIGAGAVIYAGIKGFDQWKKQKLTERKMEIAERIHTASYRAQAALNRVRSPMMWAAEEYAARAKLEEDKEFIGNNPKDRQKRLVTAQAYYTRLSKVREERLALEEAKPLANVLFGQPVEQALEKLDHQFWVVQTYVDEYIDHGEAPPPGNGPEPNGLYIQWQERNKLIKAAIYRHHRNDDDEIGKAVKEASAVIDAAVAEILTGTKQ